MLKNTTPAEEPIRGLKIALIKVKKSRSASDFLVCVVNSRSPARRKDELWCFVDSSSVADSKICYVGSRSVADLLVCFVNSRSAAGWRKEHPLKGKIAYRDRDAHR